MSKTMSVRMDRDNYDFLAEFEVESRLEKEDYPPWTQESPKGLVMALVKSLRWLLTEAWDLQDAAPRTFACKHSAREPGVVSLQILWAIRAC